jgi:single-stranded-DNA-specific exonuclease
MVRKWVFNQQKDDKTIAQLSEAINVNPVLASILVSRDVLNFDQAKTYFRPDLDQLHDPFLMQDMEVAVTRLESAIKQGENILVYGDYDVDGTTSVAMVYHFLSSIYNNVAFYIPDRYKEGYGISRQGIEWAAENGYSLMISLDCGIKANDLVELANDKGIDFIICDHHTPGDEIPNAVAVLDPKRRDCSYPYKELSGCGVGFKLIQAFASRNNISKEKVFEYLDLLAISIASDIVPISGENRVLAYYGLLKINTSPRPGIKALISLSGKKAELDISGVVFGLGPRINAAGRIAHAKGAVDLLLSKNIDEATEFGGKINQQNDKRRDVDRSITEEALELIESDSKENANTTVLYQEHWHKGVIGIVASRCIENYYRPTVILTESEGKATGSARSVDGYNVYNAISSCEDLLDQYGGHMYAAGLSMPIAHVEKFKERFEDYVSSTITDDQKIPKINVDAEIAIDDITDKFYKILRQMSPFGPENMTPVFVMHNVTAKGAPLLLKDIHLKLKAEQSGSSKTIDCIGFGMGHVFEQVKSGQPFSIAFTIEENDFRNVKSLQLFIKDIKFVI